MSESMNPENAEISPKQSSDLQALTLSNMRREWGKMLQEQRRTSLLQDSAKAQALRGQEALLVEIAEEEMAHQTQLSVLLHLHL